MDVKLSWPEEQQLQQQQQQTTGVSGADDVENETDGGGDRGAGVRNSVRLQQDLHSAISENGHVKIETILEQVKTLEPLERLFLYLKLPTEGSDNVDPLRQSLNPLGSRTEIHQTINWIQTHLEEDKNLSLQKKAVYDKYVDFCQPNEIKPLSTADFGKVMKQVYPNVRPRRLGTRGQSQYCYSGLRQRVKLNSPLLPDLSDKPLSTENNCNQSDLLAAAWIIVKEWAEKKFSQQFKSLTFLAQHLVREFSIGLNSEAANLVSSSLTQVKEETITSHSYLSRHKETTLQLQRKLQQKHEGKEPKRKQNSPKMEQKRCKRVKASPSLSMATTSTSSSTSPVAAGDSKYSPQSQELSSVCDSPNLQSLPDFNCFQRLTPGTTVATSSDVQTVTSGEFPNVAKVPIPRITNPKQSPVLSPKRAKNNKYKAIQPKPETTSDRLPYNSLSPKQPIGSRDPRDARSQQHQDKRPPRVKQKEPDGGRSPIPITPEESTSLFTRERLISIGQVSKHDLDGYLGTSSSQEQEEEISQYFNNNEDHEKISQLRQLLESNQEMANTSIIKTAPKSVMNIQNLSAKRRVSFDVVSPNLNAKQNTNFIPISPSSPNGRVSMSSSTNASPFVSPGNTPVPRARGNSHPYLPQNTLKKNEKRKPNLEISIAEVNMAMSAPPSPKTYYKQNMGNFQCNPVQNINYNGITDVFVNDTFRSQSVPLNQQQHLIPQFMEDQNPNEFSDIDNINVNEIITDIGFNEFNNPRVQLNENLSIQEELAIEPDLNPRLVRSQSMNLVDYSCMRFPSRSVPSTPIPYSHIDLEPFNKTYGNNSKSYPSTPLTADTFTYNPGQDYLLNGQPIKEKPGDFITDEKTNIYHTSYDESLMESKNFVFDGTQPPQPQDGGGGGASTTFGAKQDISNVLNEGVDYFKGE